MPNPPWPRCARVVYMLSASSRRPSTWPVARRACWGHGANQGSLMSAANAGPFQAQLPGRTGRGEVEGLMNPGRENPRRYGRHLILLIETTPADVAHPYTTAESYPGSTIGTDPGPGRLSEPTRTTPLTCSSSR